MSSVSVVSAVFSIIPAIYGFVKGLKKYHSSLVSRTIKYLKTEKRKKIINKLKKSGFLENYIQILKFILKFLNKKFDLAFHNKSLNLTTNFAVLYSFAIFLFIYLYSGNGKLTSITILNDFDFGYRILYFLIGLVVCYYTFKYFNNYKSKNTLRKHFIFYGIAYIPVILVLTIEWHLKWHIPDWLRTLIIILFASSLSGGILNVIYKRKSGALLFAVIFILLVYGSAFISTLYQINGFSWLPLGFLFTFLFLIYLIYQIHKNLGNGYIYWANLVMVFLYMYMVHVFPDVLGKDKISSVLIFFFVLLPSINGLYDWLSLSLSRIFAQKIVKDPSNFNLIKYIFIGFIVAIGLLVLLLFTFIAGINFFNILMYGDQSGETISMIDLIKSLTNNPFSPNGLWFLIMLLSTLIPTFIHLFIATIFLFFKEPYNSIQLKLITTVKNKDYSDKTISSIIWKKFGLYSLNAIVLLASLIIVYLIAKSSIFKLLYDIAIIFNNLFI